MFFVYLLSDPGGCGGARRFKVWDLLQGGAVAVYTLVRMLDLLGDSPWVSHVAEQLHASAALVSRHHPDYFLMMLLSRCMLVFVNKMLPRQSQEQKAIGKVRHKLAKVQRRCPEKNGARQICFSDMSKMAKPRLALVSGARRLKAMQHVMKKHVTTFSKLNRREKKLRAAKTCRMLPEEQR